MPSMLTLEAIGPRGEALAMRAGEALDIPVGFDPEFDCATFDSDDHDEAGLEAAVFDALDAVDADWRSQLRVAD
jgi:hypothetical protein